MLRALPTSCWATTLCPESLRAVVNVLPPALLCLLLTSCTGISRRSLSVEVERPPALGFHLDAVAIAPPPPEEDRSFLGSVADWFSSDMDPAECRSELVPQVTEMLLSGGVQVVDYDNREEADVTITINVTRCGIDKTMGVDRQGLVAKTDVEFRGSFQVVDVSTGCGFRRMPSTHSD